MALFVSTYVWVVMAGSCFSMSIANVMAFWSAFVRRIALSMAWTCGRCLVRPVWNVLKSTFLG